MSHTESLRYGSIWPSTCLIRAPLKEFQYALPQAPVCRGRYTHLPLRPCGSRLGEPGWAVTGREWLGGLRSCHRVFIQLSQGLPLPKPGVLICGFAPILSGKSHFGVSRELPLAVLTSWSAVCWPCLFPMGSGETPHECWSGELWGAAAQLWEPKAEREPSRTEFPPSEDAGPACFSFICSFICSSWALMCWIMM